MLEIYEVGCKSGPWDTAAVAKPDDKKRESQRYAVELADRLARFKPPLISETDWCIKSGLSRSFFSNMRGTPTKPPSVPSVENLRAILGYAGVSLSEFFLPEAGGVVGHLPNRQALERALADALVKLPKKPGDRLPYLLDTVLGVLALPADRPARSATQRSEAAA